MPQDPTPHHNHPTVGFSVVECLMATLILMVAVVGIFPMVVVTTKGNTFDRDRINAANAARKKIEELQAMPYDAVGVGVSTTTTPYLGFFESDPVVAKGYTAGADVYFSDTVELSPNVRGTRTVAVEAVDDTLDGVGNADTDGQLVDYKKITATLTWSEKRMPRSLKQITYIRGQSFVPIPDPTDSTMTKAPKGGGMAKAPKTGGKNTGMGAMGMGANSGGVDTDGLDGGT